MCSIGIFVSVVAQILAATALLTTILPLNHLAAALISIVLMAFYVVFGGVWGAGMGGVAKLILLYVTSILGGVLVFGLANGFSGLMETLNALGDRPGKTAMERTVRALGGGLDRLSDSCMELEKVLKKDDPEKILAVLAETRKAADALEGVLVDDAWPLPKYREMLFVY